MARRLLHNSSTPRSMVLRMQIPLAKQRTSTVGLFSINVTGSGSTHPRAVKLHYLYAVFGGLDKTVNKSLFYTYSVHLLSHDSRLIDSLRALAC